MYVSSKLKLPPGCPVGHLPLEVQLYIGNLRLPCCEEAQTSPRGEHVEKA